MEHLAQIITLNHKDLRIPKVKKNSKILLPLHKLLIVYPVIPVRVPLAQCPGQNCSLGRVQDPKGQATLRG